MRASSQTRWRDRGLTQVDEVVNIGRLPAMFPDAGTETGGGIFACVFSGACARNGL